MTTHQQPQGVGHLPHSRMNQRPEGSGVLPHSRMNSLKETVDYKSPLQRRKRVMETELNSELQSKKEVLAKKEAALQQVIAQKQTAERLAHEAVAQLEAKQLVSHASALAIRAIEPIVQNDQDDPALCSDGVLPQALHRILSPDPRDEASDSVVSPGDPLQVRTSCLCG